MPAFDYTQSDMIKSLVIILAIAAVSIHYSDLQAESALHSILLPLLALLSLTALALWLVHLFHRRAISQKTRPGGTGMDFLDGGGDGG